MKKIFPFFLISALFCASMLYLLFLQKGGPVQPVESVVIPLEESISGDKRLKLMFVGDIMLGRTVLTKSLDELKDYNYPFEKVREVLNTSDIVIANLESPVAAACPRYKSGFTFCTEPIMVKGLTDANIGLVALANNHILNFGPEGLAKTKEVLREEGIGYSLGDLYQWEMEGIKLGFISLNLVEESLNEKHLSLIRESNDKVDLLIVGPHWGVEYKDKASMTQREYAKSMIETGADLIAGHHPHWVQDREWIDNKLVLYSLGNFVFDQMWSEETRKGTIAVVDIVFDEKRAEKVMVERVNFIDTYIRNWAQPEIVNP